MNSSLIWQPRSMHQSTNEFGILLDSRFAKEMLERKMSKEGYQRMFKMPKEFGIIEQLNPYIFHEDSCLLRQITIKDGTGKWLALETMFGEIPGFDKPFKYSTHNFDRAKDSDVKTILSLFDLYVTYSGIL